MNYLNFTSLAAVSGEGLVNQLLFILIIGICLLIIWWLGKYFISKLGAPPLALTVWNGLFVLLGALCAINFLLSLIDKPFIRW